MSRRARDESERYRRAVDDADVRGHHRVADLEHGGVQQARLVDQREVELARLRIVAKRHATVPRRPTQIALGRDLVDHGLELRPRRERLETPGHRPVQIVMR